MANDNIYDIILSEEVARKDSDGSSGGGQTSLHILMDTSSLIAVSTSIPNPITITSDIINIPDLWEIVPNSHIIYFNLGGGFVAQPGAGSDSVQINEDANGGTSDSDPDVIERQYFSEIKLREIADPINEATYSSIILTITTVSSIYYGFSASTPSSPSDLSNSILSVGTVLPVTSNNVFEDFYIIIPNTVAQPVTIVDEHSNIYDIDTEWEIIPPSNGLSAFVTYKYKWPIKFTGSYLHNFTLIYS